MNAPVCHLGSASESNRAASVSAEPSYRLEHVSDTDLLAGTRRLVGRQNQVLAELLAHLAEVEARGIHRLRACSSLYTYCVYELRWSEDAAFRRVRAARLARRFTIIFQQVADGELHLTALVLLAPHLTEENHRELLALAKHRTKREVLRLVRKLAPKPSVPDRVEPLGPDSVGIPIPRPPTWRNLVESLAAGVRELPPGDRPKDRIDCAGALARWRAGAAAEVEGGEPLTKLARDNAEFGSSAEFGSEGETGLERYKVSFTASQEYVDLLERAQDLLSHVLPQRALEEVHLRALRLLVEELEKRKYGAPRRKSSAERSASETATSDAPSAAPATSGDIPTSAEAQHARTTRRRGSAAVRREVWDRDQGRCTYVDECGTRCRETRFLELHHLHAHARGGGETVLNLTLRCAAHNALAAEYDFGREFMRKRSRRRQR